MLPQGLWNILFLQAIAAAFLAFVAIKAVADRPEAAGSLNHPITASEKH